MRGFGGQKTSELPKDLTDRPVDCAKRQAHRFFLDEFEGRWQWIDVESDVKGVLEVQLHRLVPVGRVGRHVRDRRRDQLSGRVPIREEAATFDLERPDSNVATGGRVNRQITGADYGYCRNRVGRTEPAR